MPQVRYTVERIDGVWKVGLNGRQFGPYSTLETAMAAATRAAHKAEVQGYEAVVEVTSREAEAPAAAETPIDAPDASEGDRSTA
jgi:hypothetical protein